MPDKSQAHRAQLHKWLTDQPFAHRGLHVAARGIPENSMAAFERAIEKNLGIELDVQLTLDGDAIVFHDYETERLTGVTGKVAELTARRLESMALLGSDQNIPTLSHVLELIAGRVPVLIEIKSRPKLRRTICSAVRRALEGYRGAVAAMSFDPHVSRWFADHAPKIGRGMVMTTRGDDPKTKFLRKYWGQRLFAYRSRAQFFAYDLQSLPHRFVDWARGRGYPVLTWTVRSEQDAILARTYTDNIIFELPDEPAQ